MPSILLAFIARIFSASFKIIIDFSFLFEDIRLSFCFISCLVASQVRGAQIFIIRCSFMPAFNSDSKKRKAGKRKANSNKKLEKNKGTKRFSIFIRERKRYHLKGLGTHLKMLTSSPEFLQIAASASSTREEATFYRSET